MDDVRDLVTWLIYVLGHMVKMAFSIPFTYSEISVFMSACLYVAERTSVSLPGPSFIHIRHHEETIEI